MDEVQRGEKLYRGTIKQDSIGFLRGLVFQCHVLQMSSSLRLQLSGRQGIDEESRVRQDHLLQIYRSVR